MSRRTNHHGGRQDYKAESTSTFCYYKQNSSSRKSGNNNFIGKFGFISPRGSGLLPFRLLDQFAEKFVRVICMVSEKRRPAPENSKPGTSKPLSPLDSQRVEAVEDCIKFINSSCTLSRSNSTTNSC